MEQGYERETNIPNNSPAGDKAEAIEPTNLWGYFEPPSLPDGIMPTVIDNFARAQGLNMGVDPAGLAMAALTVCCAAIPDSIQLQVKVNDEGWLEPARIWVALVGEPSTKKTPIMNAAAKPIRKLDAAAYERWAEEKRQYEPLDKEDKKLAFAPIMRRHVMSDTTDGGPRTFRPAPPMACFCFRTSCPDFSAQWKNIRTARVLQKIAAFGSNPSMGEHTS